jgi:hypothetical protein
MNDAPSLRLSAPATNRLAAERLREAATLLEQQKDNPYRVAAFRRAAENVARLDRHLSELFKEGGFAALDAIPGVGPGIAAALAEMIRTGHWSYLERLRGGTEPHDTFRSVPGVGDALARRLHETLGVETLQELEAALHDPKRKKVVGLGPRRLAMLRASLGEMLARIRPRRAAEPPEPAVDLLLDVDREYRAKAEAGKIPRIAPKRFNPRGEAWLPILHTQRGQWHFTALYSNTALAHRLGKMRDWVVLYFHSDGGAEAQRTIVTEVRGALAGHRVVRGRERECFELRIAPTSEPGSAAPV